MDGQDGRYDGQQAGKHPADPGADAQVDELFRRAEANEGYQLTADLPNQTVSDTQGLKFHFDMDDFRKTVLLEGLDDIGMTLKHEPEITSYEQRLHPQANLYGAVDFKQ